MMMVDLEKAYQEWQTWKGVNPYLAKKWYLVLVENGYFSKKEEKPKKEKPKKPEEFPTMRWTEKKIAEWLKKHKIPIKYDIKKQTKKEFLKAINDYFA